jgi:hypothetical protein
LTYKAHCLLPRSVEVAKKKRNRHAIMVLR